MRGSKLLGLVRVMAKVLHVIWGLPLTKKVYMEVGMVMTEVLRLTNRVILADEEGVALELIDGLDDETVAEVIDTIRKHVKHVEVWLEGEES